MSSNNPYSSGACAHRGDNYVAPENTLPAFELAIEKGAHQIEFDLRVTKDDQIIVMHDDTVDRTTDGTGKTTDLTFDEVRALDAGSWKGERYKGVRVPTFREVLALVPPGLAVNVQLYLEPRYVGAVIDQIGERDLLEECFLACPEAHSTEARCIDPRIKICNLEGQRGPDSDYPDRTIALGAQFIQLCGWADCMPEVVSKLHQHGVKVNYFGTHVNRAARIEPITNPGNVYASEQFASLLMAGKNSALECNYVGIIVLPKKFGKYPIYHLKRKNEID